MVLRPDGRSTLVNVRVSGCCSLCGQALCDGTADRVEYFQRTGCRAAKHKARVVQGSSLDFASSVPSAGKYACCRR